MGPELVVDTPAGTLSMGEVLPMGFGPADLTHVREVEQTPSEAR